MVAFLSSVTVTCISSNLLFQSSEVIDAGLVEVLVNWFIVVMVGGVRVGL